MKFAVTIVAIITATHAQFPENPILEGLSVKYLDVSWEEHLALDPKLGTETETYPFIELAQPEVDQLRARKEPEVGFWFNPDYVADLAAKSDAEWMPIQ